MIAFQRRLEADAFDFNDFLDQFKRMNNMGGLQVWVWGHCGRLLGSTLR